MKYLIHDPEADSVQRNFQAWLDKGTREPINVNDTMYRYATRTHPTTGEVATCIPDSDADPEAGIFTQEEIDSMVDSLDASWTPEEPV